MITIHFSAQFGNDTRYHGKKDYPMAGEGHITANIDSVITAMRSLLMDKCKGWNIDPTTVTYIQIYYYNEQGENEIFKWGEKIKS